MTRISVIIPTHNRVEHLRHTLNAFAAQTLPHALYEVIVVADGCSDSTVKMLSDLQTPYKLTVHEMNPQRGAAAARNLGAAQAKSDLLLFLDDDMEASDGLLAAHTQAHREGRGSVILGYFPMQPPAAEDDTFTKAARLWWADNFAARSAPGYRFTLKDFCTGNVSVSRDLFQDIGGFDERIDMSGAGEDYELGYRLLQQGAHFHFSRDAASIHRTDSSLALSLRRAEQEGYGQAMLVKQHPELFREFNVSRLSRAADNATLRPFWRALWAWPGLATLPAACLQVFVSILSRLQIYSLLWRFYGPLRGYFYWKGVRAAAGNLAAWERLGQDAPLEPLNVREVDLELMRDLDKLELLFDSDPVDAVRVWLNGEPVGRIPPRPGAERLRAEHVRSILVERFPGALLGVLIETRAGSRPLAGAAELIAVDNKDRPQRVERSQE